MTDQSVTPAVTRQPRPTTPADLHRLAAVAAQRGLRLTQESVTVWFCSSASGGDPHYVTGLSCDCRGFMEHQRCTHHAALLAHLGWLPELEAETPAPAPQQCFWCSGSGRIPNDDAARFDRCESCGGSGVRTPSLAIPLQGRPAVEILAEAA